MGCHPLWSLFAALPFEFSWSFLAVASEQSISKHAIPHVIGKLCFRNEFVIIKAEVLPGCSRALPRAYFPLSYPNAQLSDKIYRLFWLIEIFFFWPCVSIPVGHVFALVFLLIVLGVHPS